MEKLQHLKERICSFENLYAAYQEAAKEKHYRDDVLRFTFNLEENLLDLQRDLVDETYCVGKYREFYVRYPKPRLIMALEFRDRIVQWAIYRQLNPYADKRFVRHSYGCRKEKGTLRAAQCLLKWVQLASRKADAKEWVIIKCDISKYFYRIDHDVALDMYRAYTDDEWFLRLMHTILNNPDVPFGLPLGANADDCPREMRLYDVGMPIGNLTSQETANVYLNALDRYCKHVLKLHFYVRYMDDFCIIIKGRDNAQNILTLIEIFLRNILHLNLSPKSQIVLVLQGCEFVGYRVTPHGLRLRKKTIAHIKSCLRHIAERYALGQIDFDDALQTVRSYHGMTENCNGYNLRRWIEENIVFQRKEKPDMSEVRSRDAPKPRRFYSIEENEDGTVDVYLAPNGTIYRTDEGVEYDVDLRVVRGVEPWEGLEEDIRARYDAWCESGEVIDL